jgi:hypothetical protein
MELEITPNPDDPEAIAAAVEALLGFEAVPAGYRSAWRDQGIRENLDDDEDPA